MPKIELETVIEAPIERVFDLARSIDLHKLSTKGTDERAIDGKTSGLIELGETVTWKAKHFGIYQKLKVQITEFDNPHMFCDVMLKGAFRKMRHIHKFRQEGKHTRMIDEFVFESPLGLLGKIVDSFFLKRYMKNFLIEKNKELKFFAENDKWKEIITMYNE